MIVTSDQLHEATITLGRSLLTPAPDYANGALAFEEAIAKEEQRRGGVFSNVWLAVHEASQHFFMWRGKQGGEFKRKLPPEVDEKDVISVSVDPTRQPAYELLDQLTSNVDACIELIDPSLKHAPSKPQVMRLKLDLAKIRAACDSGYNNKTVATLTKPVLEEMVAAFTTKNHEEIEKQLKQLKMTGESLRDSLAADCILSGWLRIYSDICTFVMTRCRDLYHDKNMVLAEWGRYVAYGRASDSYDPIALTSGLITKGLREGYIEEMNKLAETYRCEGEELVEKGLSAETADDWGNALYGAGLAFFLGNRVFQGLGGAALDSDPNKQEQYRKAKNDAEEKQTLVATALLFAVKNLDGKGLAGHMDKVSTVKRTGGEKAATILINDLIERQYFYPRCFKRLLAS